MVPSRDIISLIRILFSSRHFVLAEGVTLWGLIYLYFIWEIFVFHFLVLLSLDVVLFACGYLLCTSTDIIVFFVCFVETIIGHSSIRSLSLTQCLICLFRLCSVHQGFRICVATIVAIYVEGTEDLPTVPYLGHGWRET